MKALLIIAGVVGYFVIGYIVLAVLAALSEESLESDEIELGVTLMIWPIAGIFVLLIILSRIAKAVGLRIIATAAVLKAWIDK